MKKLSLLFAFVSFCSLLTSTIYEINQDGSGDYTVIQDGINVAANGDTVLVYPGTYFENLEIIEKAITIGSLYLTTGDEIWISYTILDGNHTSSVIQIENSIIYYDMSIVGFVIQNGIGYLHNSDDRSGGGLYIKNSNITINNCIIQNNHTNRHAGGVALLDSFLDLSGCTIRFNESHRSSGGLLISGSSSSVTFDSEDLNSIYLNYSAKGNDIYVSHTVPFQEIILDTFTVINPDDDYYFIYPSSNSGLPIPDQYSTNIQHGYVDQAEQDLYVSPIGDNINSGLTPTDPLQTIAYAMVKIKADSLVKRTVHIADGTYSVSQNNQIWPIQIKSFIDIIGESMENTILDAEHQEGFFYGMSGQKNLCIMNLSLLHNLELYNVRLYLSTDVKLENLYMDDGFCQSLFAQVSDVTLINVTQVNTTGGGIYYNSGLHTGIFNIINCKINNNYGNIPISCTQASNFIVDSLQVNILNSEINNNEALFGGWSPVCTGVYIDFESNLNLINSTIGDNFSSHTGAAVLLAYHSEANIINSIIYGNVPYNIGFTEGPNTLTTYSSLIGGGISGMLGINNNIINWDDETMLDEDPLWLGAGYEYPYALSSNSPCIDSGELVFPYGLELPAYDLAGNPRVMSSNIDMGAYEFPGNAAPIYLQVDNEILSWQIPAGHSPTGYNIYLDGEFLSVVSVFLSEYTFTGLNIGDTYTAGVSALYSTEETAIIPHQFIYQPVGSPENQLPFTNSQLSIFPNPFNPETTISYNIPESGKVDLSIYNIKGQKVKTLINAQLSSGKYSTTWNGKNNSNKRVSTGEYIAKFKINGEEVAVNKMLLLK
jgi:FlgD Ig-like domain